MNNTLQFHLTCKFFGNNNNFFSFFTSVYNKRNILFFSLIRQNYKLTSLLNIEYVPGVKLKTVLNYTERNSKIDSLFFHTKNNCKYSWISWDSRLQISVLPNLRTCFSLCNSRGNSFLKKGWSFWRVTTRKIEINSIFYCSKLN